MEQLASAPPPDGSFGALRRAFRHWAGLSREQLAARAELSERTLRNLEAGRVTVALLTGDAQNASALAITCRIDKAGELVLVIRCAQRDAARYPVRLPGMRK